MACVARLGVGHLEAWRLPIAYVAAMLDAAIDLDDGASGEGGGRRGHDEFDEPVTTPDGIEYPSGLARLARLTAGVS